MSEEIKNEIVPELRFPEFRDSEEWELKSLEEVAKIGRGKSKHRPRDASILFGGIYPFIQTGDIRKADLYLTDYTQTYSEEGLKQGKLWDENTLCITIAANIAETAILKIKACFPDSVIGLIPKADKSILLFVKYLFDNFKIQIQRESQGMAQDNLNQEKLSNLEFAFPSIQEQQKIADCLSSLDELITAENQKLEAFKTHKKGLMQQLFPAEGETVPKLRFAEFRDDGDWEEITLKSAARMQAGKFVSASEISEIKNDGLFPCYGGNGLRGYTKSFTNTGKYSLIGRQGALCGNITLVDGQFHATEHAVVVTPEKNVDTVWLYYVLIHLNLNQYSTGQAQPGLSVNNLEKLEIEIPILIKEQQKIADCLSSLDELITAQTEQIATLKMHKKGLMQGLFPSINESGG